MTIEGNVIGGARPAKMVLIGSFRHGSMNGSQVKLAAMKIKEVR